MITENDFSFELRDQGLTYLLQNILINNEIVGLLETRYSGILEKHVKKYWKSFENTEENRKKYNGHCQPDGSNKFINVYFFDIEDFIKCLNDN